MKKRIQNKFKKQLLVFLLGKAVSTLDGNKCRTRVLRIPSIESKTVARVNGYRVEIHPSNETKHKYPHFHVAKGKKGMASIRIDTVTVIKSSLPNKDQCRILKWAGENRQLLLDVWSEFHGRRIIVE